jgi:hypothetical protein
MGKIIWIIGFLILSVQADEIQESTLDTNCLACHQEQQIPSALIYKRYLMKYSTDARMEEAIYTYLKDPDQAYSIMPAPFFSKFPMKEKGSFNDVDLRKNIRLFLEKYTMKSRFILEE